MALTVILLVNAAILGPADAADAEDEFFFTVMHTNDIHAALDGFPYLASQVEEIRAVKEEEGELVLLTDGGDILGGHPFSWLNLQGMAPELTLLQELGYDFFTIGNHEFDINDLVLAQILKDAGYPNPDLKPVILASNINPPPVHPLAEEGLLNKTYIQELESGLKIGWFGLVGRGAMPPTIYKHGPVEFTNPYRTAREVVDELQSQGADLIIALTHAGPNDNRRLAQEVPEINLILGGHSHTPIDPVYEEDTLIFQSSDALKLLGVLELAFDPGSGRLRLRESDWPYQIPLDRNIEPDSAFEKRVAELRNAANNLAAELTDGSFTDIDEVIAYSAFDLNHRGLTELSLGNFFTDALRLVTEEKTGQRVDFAWQSTGLFGVPVDKGNITFSDMAAVPYLGTGLDMVPGNPVVSFYLTGKEIYNILEVSALLVEMSGDNDYFLQISGLRYRYNPHRSILFHAPIVDMPVPSLHAVVDVEFYTGEGPQALDSTGYVKLRRNDQTLYRVATESNVMVHVPEIGRQLPWLAIVPKDEFGNPLDYIDEYGNVQESIIVYDEQGRELKTWQVLVEYASMQEVGSGGIPQIPDYYENTEQRIITVWTIPLMIWPALFLVGLVALIIVLRKRRKRRKAAAA